MILNTDNETCIEFISEFLSQDRFIEDDYILEQLEKINDVEENEDLLRILGFKVTARMLQIMSPDEGAELILKVFNMFKN